MDAALEMRIDSGGADGWLLELVETSLLGGNRETLEKRVGGEESQDLKIASERAL
jgi:hypothetical protein